MAKRKRKRVEDELAPADPADIAAAADSVLMGAIKDVETRATKKGMWVSSDPAIVCLPVPSLAVRYMLQSTGLPLGRVYQLVGPQKSYKSTGAVEIGRWHCLCGGRGVLHEAETKPTPDLRNSVLHWQDHLLRVEDCASLEDWMRKVMWFNQAVQKKCNLKDGPGKTLPFFQIVDSMLGKACEDTIKKVLSEGAPKRDFAMEANFIKTYMQVYPQQLHEWPFTFLGINHQKMGTDGDGMPERKIPGGYALKFQNAAQFEFKKVRGLQTFANYKKVTLHIMTHECSYGPDRKRIEVEIIFWYQEDSPGVRRLYCRWEWWASSIHMLFRGAGMSKADFDRYQPKIKEIVDLHEKSMGSAGKMYWSDALGVPSSDPIPAHDLGVLLEKQQDMLDALYAVLGVQQRALFQPGVDFLSQQEGYAHVIEQSMSAKAKAEIAATMGPAVQEVAQAAATDTEGEDA